MGIHKNEKQIRFSELWFELKGRKDERWTQTKLAKLLDVTPSAVSQFLSGDATPKTSHIKVVEHVLADLNQPPPDDAGVLRESYRYADKLQRLPDKRRRLIEDLIDELAPNCPPGPQSAEETAARMHKEHLAHYRSSKTRRAEAPSARASSSSPPVRLETPQSPTGRDDDPKQFSS
jgi:transcriptional regulator with XRE-family HTH domain